MIRDVQPDDITDVIELANRYLDLAVEGYTLHKPTWIQHVLNWMGEAQEQKALFQVAYDGDKILGFMIAIPTAWHYSPDVYLDIKEMFVDEDLSKIKKAKLVLKFTNFAEERAREAGLKGISAFSIRDNSDSYGNFFCNKLGWTKVAGAKKIF